MKDYQVSNHNLHTFIDELQNEINDNKLMIVSTQQAGTGKWGMARLWRKWMATTAKFMSSRGVTVDIKNSEGVIIFQKPFNGEDAHELFTGHHLGLDENGNRLSWRKSSNKDDESRTATKGERFNALRKHENWCLDKGIILFKPRDCEYEKLAQEQEQ